VPRSDVILSTLGGNVDGVSSLSQVPRLHPFTLHFAVTALLAVLAGVWMILATQTLLGMRRLPRLSAVTPLPDRALPTASILVSARDEAEKMPAALRSLVALDYPAYEVIVVDDRSGDSTGEILREFSATYKHLRAVRVDALPPGWLGKPHGLQTAYEQSRGEWLVFTDADVRFHTELLRRAVSLALERGWDHLSMFPDMEMKGFWEKTVLTSMAVAFLLYTRPWSVSRPRSRAYLGVGAFQLLRRSGYEAIGTHRRLAREVVDDMKLGRLVKDAGLKSATALSCGLLSLRWQDGIGNIIRGAEKNFFAVSGFRVGRAVLGTAAVLLLNVAPFLALPFVGGWGRLFAAAAAGCCVVLSAGAAHRAHASPLYGLTHPLGAFLCAFIAARSTFLTLRQKGIYWRGTFYPLEDLRRGAV